MSNAFPALLLVVLLLGLAGCSPSQRDVVQVGSGSYRTVPPSGLIEPDSGIGLPGSALREGGAIPDGYWWSSLEFSPITPLSEAMLAYPLALQAEPTGLTVWSTGAEDQTATRDSPSKSGLLLGLAGLRAAEARVSSFGDWSVSAIWASPEDTLVATFGRGLPFVWLEGSPGTLARVEFGPALEASLLGDTAVLSGDGGTYAVFAPTGTDWTAGNGFLEAPSSLFSAAVLPDATPETVARFRDHAFAVARDTQVSWSVDGATGQVTTVFDIVVESLDTVRSSAVLLAPFPHHQVSSGTPTGLGTLPSPIGDLTLLAGSGFTTTARFPGVLPRLPDYCLSAADDELRSLVAAEWDSGASTDTGVSTARLNRLTDLVDLAWAAGNQGARDLWSAQLRESLESWLTVTDTTRYYWYDHPRRTLRPFDAEGPANMPGARELAGIHIRAAAAVARTDSQWVAAFGPMVETVIHSFSGWDREYDVFPFLGSFDPYLGLPAGQGQGDIAERIGASLNASAALILWGLESGSPAIRDLGIWQYVTELAARERTSERDPNEFLPLTTASMTVPKPDYLARWDESTFVPGASATDVMLAALVDPEGVGRWYYEFGGSLSYPADGSPPHTQHWVSVLQQLGRVDTTVTADATASMAFHNGRRRAYVAYNPGTTPLPVTFSDGTMVRLPSKTQVTVCR